MKLMCKHPRPAEVICIDCHRKGLEGIARELRKTKRLLSSERLNRSFLATAVQNQGRMIADLKKQAA